MSGSRKMERRKYFNHSWVGLVDDIHVGLPLSRLAMTGNEHGKSPGNAPLTNGSSSVSLDDVCAQLHQQVQSFLQEDVETEILRSVQKQCRHSLVIIHEAIKDYPYAFCPLVSPIFSNRRCLIIC